MIPVMVRTIVNLVTVIINALAIRMTFQKKYHQRVSFISFTLFTIVLIIIFFSTGAVNLPYGGVLGSYGGAYGLLYLPLIVFLSNGLFFQKIFVVVSQLLISVTQSYLVMAIVEIFIPYGSDEYFLVLLAALIVVYAAYIWMMLKYGWSFMKKLFAFGRQSEWALYTLGAMLSYAALMLLHDADLGRALYIFLVLFILWGFAVMCFAIINTHEKSRQRYEADFARNILASGREHYQQMNELYDELRILRHDYKYHLNTINELINTGDTDMIKNYLTDITTLVSENEIRFYCSNSIINALLSNYAERCERLNIEYNVQLSFPESLSIPNYEICIVLGNLLENAVEACEKLRYGRYIELSVKTQGEQLAVMVKNSFIGVTVEDNGQLVSAKKDGGFGLRSVQAVAVRYDGYLLTQWDDDTFSTYVLLSM